MKSRLSLIFAFRLMPFLALRRTRNRVQQRTKNNNNGLVIRQYNHVTYCYMSFSTCLIAIVGQLWGKHALNYPRKTELKREIFTDFALLCGDTWQNVPSYVKISRKPSC